MTTHFLQPPHITNENGDERKTGIELEFSGVELGFTARLVKKHFGGEVIKLSAFKFEARNTRYGTFTIELDAQLLRDKMYEEKLRKIGIELSRLDKEQKIEERIEQLASSVVPYEIITPPLPISKLPELEPLFTDLRNARAKGTGASIFYAFGLHLNPEAPSLQSTSLLRHLKAFILLELWIRADTDLDVSRRISPFIDEFSSDYIEKVVAPDYQPDLVCLIEDYLEFNPTRNRSLDMLPIFEHLDFERVSNKIKDGKTTARPAYHYRLPNCQIDDPEWSLADEWNRWVLVEKLADNRKKLRQFGFDYQRIKAEKLIGFKKQWISHIQKWVDDVRK